MPRLLAERYKFMIISLSLFYIINALQLKKTLTLLLSHLAMWIKLNLNVDYKWWATSRDILRTGDGN